MQESEFHSVAEGLRLFYQPSGNMLTVVFLTKTSERVLFSFLLWIL